MQPGTVSVVVPCFNSEAYLEETIDSILSQQGVRLELVLVDDGSSDQTPAILQKYTSRATCFSGPNQGASAARNQGTAVATGDWIQYVDSDDLLLQGALRARVAALQDSGADVAYSDWQEWIEVTPSRFEVGRTVCTTIESVDPDPEIACATRFWVPPAALMYSRDIVERIGGWHPDLPVIQDARFLQDAALRGARFVHVPVIGARYRKSRAPSLSTGNTEAFYSDVLRNALEIEDWWKSNGGINAARKRALHEIYDLTARMLFEVNQPLFRESLDSLYRVSPRFDWTWPKVAGAMARPLGPRLTLAVMRRLTQAKQITNQRLTSL